MAHLDAPLRRSMRTRSRPQTTEGPSQYVGRTRKHPTFPEGSPPKKRSRSKAQPHIEDSKNRSRATPEATLLQSSPYARTARTTSEPTIVWDGSGSPRRNPWVETKIGEGVFGSGGAGLEAIAAGGMHTLFIDEKGTVWSCGVNDDAALGRLTEDVTDPNEPGSYTDVDILTAFPHPLQSLVDEHPQ
ncbi:hypothetical protein F5I97DRAFT_1826689 [Phlebopus sp. FC_14]|nr:hypothetical protein F5I97DRAFT_1826689 [Phlebopus sp. FC_14]